MVYSLLAKADVVQSAGSISPQKETSESKKYI